MHGKQAIMVDDGTVVSVTTGDRYMVSGIMDGSSPSEPSCDALTRHDFGIGDDGSVLVSGGDGTVIVSVMPDDSDGTSGNGIIRFYGRDGESLECEIRNGMGIVADGSSFAPPRVTFASLHDSVPLMVVVDGGTVSATGDGRTLVGPDGVDYASDLVDALRRMCDALGSGNSRLYATISPFVCGVQRPWGVAPVDWLVDSTLDE